MTYEPYDPDGAHGTGGTDSSLGAEGPWRIAVEYSNKGQAKPSTIVQLGRAAYTDRETALLAAKSAAFEYDPPDPWSPKSRAVFRDGPDGFLVVIEGATATFHMSVRLVAPVSP